VAALYVKLRRASPILRFGFGLLLFAVSLLLRFQLDETLPPGYPYLTFFPAVILTTFIGGLWPGIVVAMLSGLAAWHSFIPPNGFGIDAAAALALAFYVIIVAVNIVVIHIMTVALDRLRVERQQLKAERAIIRQLTKERARDAAEVHASRGRLNTMISQAAVGITLTSPAGEFLVVNDCFCRIVGRRREDILGRRMQDFTHPDDLAGNLALRARMFETGKPFSYQKRYIRPDGSIVWVQNEIALTRDPQGSPDAIVGIVQDITAQKRADENRKLLLNELNHRVKNTLATVQSIAMQTQRATTTPEEFFEAFTSRLMALSRGHDLLTQEAWTGASLENVIRQTLTPFVDRDVSERVHLEGPDVRLPPNAAVALNMGFHELATNAAKYGALSQKSGHVAVKWMLDVSSTPPEVTIVWSEHGGPPVRAPRRHGFGSRLIQRGIARELDGEVRLDFDPRGLRCTIRLPIEAPKQDFAAMPTSAQPTRSPSAAAE
jgi:PAS domain S-box-containing protein